MLELPEGLEIEFQQEIEQFEQERQMTYISSIKRRAEQKGRQEEVETLLIAKFDEIDDALRSVVEPLMQCSATDRARMILQLSREELMIDQFQPPSE